METKPLELAVNGSQLRGNADPEQTLLSFLRDELGLTGAKYGCGEGECGACTVLIDGVPTRSCRTKALAAAGKKIRTIEGLETDGKLHPVQQAFLEADAFQCGYCTSGMILAGVALLEKKPNPSRSEIISGMERNICRCGTYPRIVAALERASKILREGVR